MMVRAVTGILLGVVVAGFAVLVAGMRWQLRPVLDAVRRFNKAVTNPRVVQTAGTLRSQTALIRHVGRRSGRPYETPITAIPTPTGFLIALPYGVQTDWLRNVLASGSATIVVGGEDVDVTNPAIVATSEVAEFLPGGQLITLRLFGVARCLQVARLT
jgi:deazaflavin-dependent oxidoreductase (nitroreductase family)